MYRKDNDTHKNFFAVIFNTEVRMKYKLVD